MLSFHWQPKTDWIGKHLTVDDDRFIFCWSAKWSDGDEVLSARLTQKQARTQDDAPIIVKLADLMRQADYVVAHNGNRFDYKRVNARLLLKKLEPLGRVQQIDTLTIARSSFDLPYNNLDYLARKLELGRKIPTDFDLWRRCYYGDVSALKEMEEYNRQDVRLLETVFYEMLPYAKNLPRLWDAVEWRQEFCPYCGSTDRKLAKVPYRTKVNSFKKFTCQNCHRDYRHWQSGQQKAGSVGL